MTNVPLKSKPFIEKITDIRLVNQETGQLLGTASTFDFFPGSISLYAFVDFFNVRPTDYIVSIIAHFPDETSYPVYATRATIEKETLLYQTEDGFGKSTGNFAFNFTIQKPSDFYFTFELIDTDGNIVDISYSYHTFTKR